MRVCFLVVVYVIETFSFCPFSELGHSTEVCPLCVLFMLAFPASSSHVQKVQTQVNVEISVAVPLVSQRKECPRVHTLCTASLLVWSFLFTCYSFYHKNVFHLPGCVSIFHVHTHTHSACHLHTDKRIDAEAQFLYFEVHQLCTT